MARSRAAGNGRTHAGHVPARSCALISQKSQSVQWRFEAWFKHRSHLKGWPEKLYPHVAAPAPIEMMNAPIWTAFNEYSRPGWTTYAVGVLGENFQAIYDMTSWRRTGIPPGRAWRQTQAFPDLSWIGKPTSPGTTTMAAFSWT